MCNPQQAGLVALTLNACAYVTELKKKKKKTPSKTKRLKSSAVKSGSTVGALANHPQRKRDKALLGRQN